MIISPVHVNYELNFSCSASVIKKSEYFHCAVRRIHSKIFTFQANQWCASGIDLLASQRIEQCSASPELAEKYLKEIQEFQISSKEFTLNGPKDFKDTFQCATIPETKALVSQVFETIIYSLHYLIKKKNNLGAAKDRGCYSYVQ